MTIDVCKPTAHRALYAPSVPRPRRSPVEHGVQGTVQRGAVFRAKLLHQLLKITLSFFTYMVWCTVIINQSLK
jgi:hypothetical protein